MLQRIFDFAVPFFLLCVMGGCCTSSHYASSSNDDSTGRQVTGNTPASSFLQRQKGAMAVLSRLGNRVRATVRTVRLIDSLQYAATLRIDSVYSEEDIPAIAEAGQEITVAPQYFQSEGGFIDPSSNQNKRLLSIRSAKSGDSFHATITPSSDGKEWKITDVRPE